MTSSLDLEGRQKSRSIIWKVQDVHRSSMSKIYKPKILHDVNKFFRSYRCIHTKKFHFFFITSIIFTSFHRNWQRKSNSHPSQIFHEFFMGWIHWMILHMQCIDALTVYFSEAFRTIKFHYGFSTTFKAVTTLIVLKYIYWRALCKDAGWSL